MKVALYLRVSTDEQASSAEEQERGAQAWCARHHHTIVATWRDVGHSGAEWVRRTGVLDLQTFVLRKDRPVDAVVVRDVDRLGRDAVRLPKLLHDLHEHGVQVIEWSTGRVVELDGAGALIVNVLAAAAAYERQLIAHRTRTSHATRAARGLVTGGKVYGWDNERHADGVRYVVNPTEAAVVQAIFERRAEGLSCRRIAQQLNAAGVPSPRAAGGGSGSWCQSQVGDVVRSPRYKGEATWGARRWTYKGGTRTSKRQDDAARIPYAVPAIVTPDLWDRAQRHSAPARTQAGRAPAGPRASRLLVGHAVCGLCGHRIVGVNTATGSGATRRILAAYACAGRRDRGVCTARYYVPAPRLDAVVLDWLTNTVLDPDRIAASIAWAQTEAARPAAPDPHLDALRAELADLDARLARVRRAVQVTDDDALLADLQTLSGQRARVEAELAAVTTPRPVCSDDHARRLVEAARFLRAALTLAVDVRPDLARDVLGAVLVGRITVTPVGEGRATVFKLEGKGSTGSLLSLTGNPSTGGDPNGITPVDGFEDPVPDLARCAA